MSVPKFSNAPYSFHTELKKRINNYFEEAGKATTGNFQLYFKAILLSTAFIAIYTHLVFFTPAIILAVLECVLLGVVIAAIGFNVMHDGAHGSFSTSPFLNRIAAFSVNVLGGSSFMWNMKHNVIHHAFTNIDGIDDDIDIKPWMRMTSTQKKLPLHKFQHIYFWFLYSLLYIFWIFVLDYQKYFKQKVGSVPLKKMSAADHLVFWGFKVFNLFLYVIIPWYVLGFVSWLVGFLIFTCVAGFVLSIVFQLAHTVEHTAFPVVNEETNRFEDEWAVHQLKTTANFATNNKLVSWFVGGLNFQIEHHLFPKISHVHYPQSARSLNRLARSMVLYISNIRKCVMLLLRMYRF